jgi:tetratricopeptide (TPR) repeat protein
MREVNNRSGEAFTLNNMAVSDHKIGQPQQALLLYEQALPIWKEVGDLAGEAMTLVNMAVLFYQDMQRRQEAITILEQALVILCANNLPQDAADQTPEMIKRILQAMRDSTF